MLGDRIAELAANIAAATGELLGLLREFDARNGWTGFASCAEWLSWRTGLAPGAAREHVRVARALGELPRLRDALRRGAVSYSRCAPSPAWPRPRPSRRCSTWRWPAPRRTSSR